MDWSKPSIPDVDDDDSPVFRHATKFGAETGSGHGLGPHVVGQRVVVRRIVRGETGPTGGPAFTDLLGTCESWTDDVATIRTATGELVTISTRDVVSGKPVPPRPSVRQRVSVRQAESHAAPLWTGVDRVALGEWELRSEPAPVGRARKRTNSCLAIGDPGTGFPEAVAAVRAFYGVRDRPAIVQVEVDSDDERAFRELGWTPVAGDAALMLGSLSRARRTLGPGTAPCVVTTDGPRVTATLPGGSGKAALDDDWFGVHDLFVDEASRRQGIAAHLLRALLEVGAELGAVTVWLHVEVDNAAARGLYERIGLTEHHRCRYLSPPD